mgnify:CR=1 FL=1
MTKNKGSFWKNNIKKIKKERKERSIKQEAKKKEARIEAEAKKKEARIEAEVKKKAKEEIERKEVEAKRIREAKEEAERKEIQKTYGKEQEPELDYEHELLLDTVTVLDVFANDMVVITKLKNYEGSNNSLFLVLDRIIKEFRSVNKFEDGKYVQPEEVITKLSLLGEVNVVKLDWNSPLARRASDLSESRKYYNKKTGECLSETDCFLLQFAIENSCTLVTADKALIDATIENGGEVFNPREI